MGDVLDDATRTITVRTTVANDDGRLKPGMFANVSIELAQQMDAVVVPTCAVIDDDRDRRLVFVAAEDGYQPRTVLTGHEEDGLVEIIDGVAPGEQVVIRGAYQLKAKLRAGSLNHND